MSRILRENNPELIELAELVRKLNEQGHNPATSGNYSIRDERNPGACYISASGVDKEFISVDQFIHLELNGHLMAANTALRPSAETPLHTMLYQIDERVSCVLHSHHLESILFANRHSHEDRARLRGHEMLKAFATIQSHKEELEIPLFDNTQDIDGLSKLANSTIDCTKHHGLILKNHGLYVWAESVSQAKVYLEAFIYLFSYENRIKGY